MGRISWDSYFLKIMETTSLRASCDRGKASCVLVRDNRVLSTGYVGSPSGIPSCDEIGHKLVKRFEMEIQKFAGNYIDTDHDNQQYATIGKDRFTTHCVRTIHAEINCLLNCARNGVSTLGSTMYISMTPCYTCSLAIIQAGVVKIICKKRYQKDEESIKILEQAGITIVVMENEVETY